MLPPPQEKSAPKPDIDAAVNELKELKIALEGAVKARCGGCWIATTVVANACAHPTRRCVAQAATEENQKEGKAKCVPSGSLHRLGAAPDPLYPACRCCPSAGRRSARSWPRCLSTACSTSRHSRFTVRSGPAGCPSQATDRPPLLQAVSRACMTTGPPVVPSRPTSLPTGAR